MLLREAHEEWKKNNTLKFDLRSSIARSLINSLIRPKHEHFVDECLQLVTTEFLSKIKRAGGDITHPVYVEQMDKINDQRDFLMKACDSLVNDPCSDNHMVGLYCKELLKNAAQTTAKMPEGGIWDADDTYVMKIQGQEVKAEVRHVETQGKTKKIKKEEEKKESTKADARHLAPADPDNMEEPITQRPIANLSKYSDIF